MYLSAAFTKDGQKVKFKYTESFESAKLVKDTRRLIGSALASSGISLRITDRGLTMVLSGTVPRAQFGNMLIGEFLNWGTLGEMTLSSLLLGTFRSANTTKKSA